MCNNSPIQLSPQIPQGPEKISPLCKVCDWCMSLPSNPLSPTIQQHTPMQVHTAYTPFHPPPHTSHTPKHLKQPTPCSTSTPQHSTLIHSKTFIYIIANIAQLITSKLLLFTLHTSSPYTFCKEADSLPIACFKKICCISIIYHTSMLLCLFVIFIKICLCAFVFIYSITMYPIENVGTNARFFARVQPSLFCFLVYFFFGHK